MLGLAELYGQDNSWITGRLFAYDQAVAAGGFVPD